MIHRSDIQRTLSRPARFSALCSCGWQGWPQATREEAYEQADEHEEAPREQT